MRKRTMWIAGAASAAVVLGGASIAVGATQPAGLPGIPGVLNANFGDFESGDDSGAPALTDADRAMASSAALAKVGGGNVTEVKRDDDSGSAYEVKVRLPDGAEVEVSLGADFRVLSQSGPEHDD